MLSESGPRSTMQNWMCELAFALALANGRGRGVEALRCEEQRSRGGGLIEAEHRLHCHGELIGAHGRGALLDNRVQPFYCTDRAAAARYSFSADMYYIIL